MFESIYNVVDDALSIFKMFFGFIGSWFNFGGSDSGNKFAAE